MHTDNKVLCIDFVIQDKAVPVFHSRLPSMMLHSGINSRMVHTFLHRNIVNLTWPSICATRTDQVVGDFHVTRSWSCLLSQVYSASSDGEDIHSCRVFANPGTSMSCPIVAGASAMVRDICMCRMYAQKRDLVLVLVLRSQHLLYTLLMMHFITVSRALGAGYEIGPVRVITGF